MTRRVLVVDDHVDFRSAVRAILEAEGFDVVAEAGTADEALRTAQVVLPDVVLLDVRLPDGDGISLACELALLNRPPQVVLVSSRPASAYGARLRDAPVRGFLSKDALEGAELRRLLAEPQHGQGR